jgi:hypothetical protein
MWCVLSAVLTVVLLGGGERADGKPLHSDYARMIVGGRWIGPRDLKYWVFYPDGRWAVQKNDDERPDSSGNRRWHIERDKLIYTFRHWHYTERILSISRTKLVLGDPPGYVMTRSRIP